jgi:hypothetical protein
MGYGSFFEGLSQGYGQRFQREQANLQNKRQQEQTDLNERRVRNTELDSIQREARRVAEQDRADEQQTMQMLMQPGLTEESRKAIRDARVARRNDNQSYIRSLSADPTNAADINKRFGDITKLITPSTIESGVMPSPTIDMLKATEYADKYRKEIGLLPENKRAGEVKYRQELLGGLGLNPAQIQKLLPDFGTVMGTTPGKASEFMDVETPFNLPENLMFGGKQFDEKLGKTIETQLQPDGKTLKKRYIEPDIEQTMTYEPDIIQTAKADKYKYEGPRIQAQIAKLNAETKAIPQRLKIQADKLLADIGNNREKNRIANLLVGVRQAGNNIRMYGLQRADARGQAMLGLKKYGLDIAAGKVTNAAKVGIQKNIAGLEKELNDYKAKHGKAIDEQRTAEGQALSGVIGFIQQQIDESKAALEGYGTDEGLDLLLNESGIQYTPPGSYPGFGGFGGYPGYGYGGGYTGGAAAPTAGGTTYNIGNQQVTAQQLAAILGSGGYNAGTVGVGGAQKKTYINPKTGKVIDPKTLIGKEGAASTRLDVGGRGGTVKVNPNSQAGREALNRLLGG